MDDEGPIDPDAELDAVLAKADELGVPTVSACRRRDGAMDCGECVGHSDCPEGEVCAIDWSTRETKCFASTCGDDDDCGEGSRCLPVIATEKAKPVTRCYPVGARQEGETCGGVRRTPETSCAAGLVCVAGACAMPCSTDESCASGECITDFDGAGCVSTTCEGVSCPDGAFCERGACVQGVDCNRPESACAEGEVCMSFGAAKSWRRGCYVRCSASSECAEGQVCSRGRCMQACTPEDLNSCDAHESCRSADEGWTEWACFPRTGTD